MGYDMGIRSVGYDMGIRSSGLIRNEVMGYNENRKYQNTYEANTKLWFIRRFRSIK